MIKHYLSTSRGCLSSGFTVVELLIAVVVIAVLATVTLISYNGVQNQARASATDVDLATFGRKLQIYYTEKTTPLTSLSDLKLNGFGNVDQKMNWMESSLYSPDDSATSTERGRYLVKIRYYGDQSYAILFYWNYREKHWSYDQWVFAGGNLLGHTTNFDDLGGDTHPCNAVRVEQCALDS